MRILALSLFPIMAFPAAAEELRTKLTVSGRQIDIHVRHEDGRPAAGLPVRLLYGRQLTTAVAHTDKLGRWSHAVAQPGAYLAVIETGTETDEPLRLPFAVLSAPEPVDFPWALAVPLSASVIGASLALAIGIKKSHRDVPGDGLTARQAFLLAGLMSAGSGLLGWSAWNKWTEAVPAGPASPDLAAAARDFLRKKEVKPLSGPLEQLLADAAASHVKTQAHPLLNQPAPEFELPDQRGETWRLHEQVARGPVVLIFYYGYHCNHCVSQLFALHDDIQKFRELGAEVLAVSADPPEVTRDRFKQYGEFAFPVLTDPGNKVGQIFGVYQPATGKTAEDLQHGTFVIGRDGHIHWLHCANEPFTGNATLLYELAQIEGRLKKGSP